jgi:hypothetical protein
MNSFVYQLEQLGQRKLKKLEFSLGNENRKVKLLFCIELHYHDVNVTEAPTMSRILKVFECRLARFDTTTFKYATLNIGA